MSVNNIIITRKALSLKEMNSMGKMLPLKVNPVDSLRGTYSREEAKVKAKVKVKVKAMAPVGELAQRIKGNAVLEVDVVVVVRQRME